MSKFFRQIVTHHNALYFHIQGSRLYFFHQIFEEKKIPLKLTTKISFQIAENISKTLVFLLEVSSNISRLSKMEFLYIKTFIFYPFFFLVAFEILSVSLSLCFHHS